jgi:hypothetical protein
MRQPVAKFVPRLLTDDQKQHRLEVSMQLKEHVRNGPDFLSKIITVDTSWIYGYGPKTKQQLSQWGCPSSSWPKKVRQMKDNVKSMLIRFFNIHRISHMEFIPPGQTVNAKCYCDILR